MEAHDSDWKHNAALSRFECPGNDQRTIHWRGQASSKKSLLERAGVGLYGIPYVDKVEPSLRDQYNRCG